MTEAADASCPWKAELVPTAPLSPATPDPDLSKRSELLADVILAFEAAAEARGAPTDEVRKGQVALLDAFGLLGARASAEPRGVRRKRRGRHSWRHLRAGCMAAYPVLVTVWNEVKLALLALEDTGALLSHPNLTSSEDRSPPIGIRLAPWAADIAEDLHRRFGNDVALVVGVLPYPIAEPPEWATRARPAIESASPAEFSFELEEKVQVRSGHSTRIGLRVHNHTPADISVRTNGNLTASVLDPETGDRVGGFGGFQAMPLVTFTVPAGGLVVIPLLIGTTSFQPELGYAVPPGQWAVSDDLTLEDGRVLRTPAMAITVTD